LVLLDCAGGSGYPNPTSWINSFVEGANGRQELPYVNQFAASETDNVKQTWAAAHTAALALRATGSRPQINITEETPLGVFTLPDGTYDMTGIDMTNNLGFKAQVAGGAGGTTLQNGTYTGCLFASGSNLTLTSKDIGPGLGLLNFINCILDGNDVSPPIVAALQTFLMVSNCTVNGRIVNASGNPVQALYDQNCQFDGPSNFFWADSNLLVSSDGTVLLPPNAGRIASSIYRWPANTPATNVINDRFVLLDCAGGSGYPNPTSWINSFVEGANGRQELPNELKGCQIQGNFQSNGDHAFDNTILVGTTDIEVNSVSTWETQNFTLPDDTLTGSANLTVNVRTGVLGNISTTHAGYSGTITVVDQRTA
jgi:hypothetical protein